MRTREEKSGPPGFPIDLIGVGNLHAAFLNESRTRGRVRCCVAGNPGPDKGEVGYLG